MGCMARDFSPEVDVPSLVIILLIPLPIELNLILAIDQYNDNYCMCGTLQGMHCDTITCCFDFI